MFNIIVKEVKGFLREKTNLFFFLLFPVLLVFLLGNLLSSTDKAEDAIGGIKLKYQADITNSFQAAAIEQFIKAAGENPNVTFEQTDDLQSAKDEAGKDEITAVIEFFGNPLKINIYEGTNRIKNRTVNAIISGFSANGRAIAAVIKTILAADPAAMSQEDSDYIKQKDLGVNRTMLDYYAVTMLAMICLFGVLQGTMVFIGERDNKTINRLYMAPQNRISIFFQKIIGILPGGILQLLIIMLFSVFIFHAHYAVSFQDNLYLFFMFFMVMLACVSVGAVVGLVIKANPMAVIFPPLWFMMFFGGTYSKEMKTDIMDKMPVYHVQKAAFDLEMFGRYRAANIVILTSLTITVVMLAAGVLIFGRKEEER